MIGALVALVMGASQDNLVQAALDEARRTIEIGFSHPMAQSANIVMDTAILTSETTDREVVLRFKNGGEARYLLETRRVTSLVMPLKRPSGFDPVASSPLQVQDRMKIASWLWSDRLPAGYSTSFPDDGGDGSSDYMAVQLQYEGVDVYATFGSTVGIDPYSGAVVFLQDSLPVLPGPMPNRSRRFGEAHCRSEAARVLASLQSQVAKVADGGPAWFVARIWSTDVVPNRALLESVGTTRFIPAYVLGADVIDPNGKPSRKVVVVDAHTGQGLLVRTLPGTLFNSTQTTDTKAVLASGQAVIHFAGKSLSVALEAQDAQPPSTEGWRRGLADAGKSLVPVWLAPDGATLVTGDKAYRIQSPLAPDTLKALDAPPFGT
ncbi:MAG: hypothetical protein AMXMBFR81_12990 [Chthonomonas sp.]